MLSNAQVEKVAAVYMEIERLSALVRHTIAHPSASRLISSRCLVAATAAPDYIHNNHTKIRIRTLTLKYDPDAEPDLLVRSLLAGLKFPKAAVGHVAAKTLNLLAEIERYVPKIIFGRSYLGVCSAGMRPALLSHRLSHRILVLYTTVQTLLSFA